MTKKRVWVLYRVSSNKQGGQNGDTDSDIPAQDKAVRKFAATKSDWEITRVFEELAVSGFKNKVKDRCLQEILEGAERDEFDILLVFANDRVGRFKKEMTTFTNLLIKRYKKELWSVLEGQKRLKTHMDTLVNDIDWWKAESKSKEISERVTPILKDMYENGEYLGGRPAYGFENYFTGVLHPKTNKAYTYKQICESEAEILRLAFQWSAANGWGSTRICKELNNLGYRQRSGAIWKPNVLHKVMCNPIVNGRQRYNMSEAFDDDEDRMRVPIPQTEWKLQPQRAEWVIIEDELFERVMNQFTQRKKNTRNSDAAIVQHGKLLLNGIAKCGYCGSKLYANYTGKKYKKQDGSGVEKEYKSFRYECPRGKVDKSGHDVYLFTASKYEPVFEQVIWQMIETASLDSFTEDYAKAQKNRSSILEKDLKKLIEQKKKIQNALDLLHDEVVKVLTGESRFTEETLSVAIEKKGKEREEIEVSIRSLEESIQFAKTEEIDAVATKAKLTNWIEKYNNATWDQKKMLISDLVEYVEFKKDEVHIEFIASLRGVEFSPMLEYTTNKRTQTN